MYFSFLFILIDDVLNDVLDLSQARNTWESPSRSMSSCGGYRISSISILILSGSCLPFRLDQSTDGLPRGQWTSGATACSVST